MQFLGTDKRVNELRKLVTKKFWITLEMFEINLIMYSLEKYNIHCYIKTEIYLGA